MEKIKFFKKLWWSTTKVSKYDEMAKLGLKSAIKYFVAILAILALILGLISTYIQATNIQKVEEYLSQTMPEFKIQKDEQSEEDKYILNLENNDVFILDNQNFIESFSHLVVINTSLEEEKAIEEYYKLATEKYNCAIFLKDKCIIISTKYDPNSENKEQGIAKYTYRDILNTLGTGINELTKTNLLGYLNNISYTYYIFAYFINYFVILITVFALDIIIIGILGLIISKIWKISINKKEIFSIAIYAYTLPAIIYIIYLIIRYFTNFTINYMNIIDILIAYIYVMIYFYQKRKKILHQNK